MDRKRVKDKEQSVFVNFLYQSLYQFLSILFPIITAPYLGRIVGANGIGIYSYTYSIAFYFVIFGRLGIQIYGNREIASVKHDKEKLNQTFSDLFVNHLLVSVISVLAYIVFCMSVFTEYKIYGWIQLTLVLTQLFDITWFFTGLEQFKVIVIRNTVMKLLTIVSIFVFVQDSGDLWKYIFILGFGSMAGELSLWFQLPAVVRFKKPNPVSMKKHFGAMLFFFIPAVAVSIYKYMDKIMLGLMAGIVDVGLYENSEKIISIPIGIITSLGTVMLPRMSGLIARGEENNIEHYINISIRFIMVLSSAMAFGIIGVSEVFPGIFLGEEFAGCSPLLRGLAISIFFTAFANVIRTQFLIPNHFDKSYIFSLCIGAVTNLVINYILIPYMGVMGAVIGTICAEGMVCIIQVAAVWKKLPIKKYLREIGPYFMIGMVMSGSVFLLGTQGQDTVFKLIYMILFGAFVYVILLLGYMLVKKDELLILIRKFLK